MMSKLLVFFLLWASFSTANGKEDLICRVKLVDIDYELSAGMANHLEFYCETTPDQEPDGEDGMLYYLDFPDGFVNDNLVGKKRDAHVAISDAHAIREHDQEGAYVAYTANSTFTILTEENHHDHRHRALNHETVYKRTIGESNLLVLRVSALDVNNTLSQELIHGRIFGVGAHTEEVNVIDQIDRCSFSKLSLKPAEGLLITHGVGDLTLDMNLLGADVRNIEDRLKTLTEQKFGLIAGNFDHLLYCMPPGTQRSGSIGWLAYAFLNSWNSYYNDEYCVNLSTVIHELGHNWNLAHSQEGAATYGDTTGYMGSASHDVGGPALCFNANKNWFLGWYADKAIEIPWDQPWGGYIYAFTDYEDVPDYGYVVVKVGRLYLQYNRAKSFNSGTRERLNQVVVVYNGAPTSPSHLGGGIGIGWGASKSIAYGNYEWSGYPLVFEACENVDGPPDYIRISIHLGGLHESTCNKNLFSDAPSNTPTSPSSFPSQMPSIWPTTSPSMAPSLEPSEVPTELPSTSQTPSILPTTSPSMTQSLLPSEIPTESPSTSQFPSSYCEDRNAHFWIDEATKTERMNCYQLAVNQTMTKRLCHSGHPAYDLCEDTCGKCNDKCEDSPGTFKVNNEFGLQSCSWLIGKPGFQRALCKPGKDAFDMCGETCNSCDVDATSTPSAAPQTGAPTPWCEDRDGTFEVRRMGTRNCVWLSRSQAWQDRLCVPNHAAYHECPELCGACTDDCEDDPGTFSVNNGQNIQDHTCKWLSVRPNIAQRLCVPTHRAYEMCGETCNSCRRRN